MNLGEFEPDAWIPSAHPAAARGVIGLDELAHLDVVHGPRRVSAETYDAWLAVLRARNARFEFTHPPFRQSLAMTLAFAATREPAHRGPDGPSSPHQGRDRTGRAGPVDTYDMVPVLVDHHPLTATAGLVWSGDLPRQLQQVLVDTAMASFFD